MKPKGSIEKLPSGRYRARLGRKTVGTYDTRAAAEIALGGGDLRAFFEQWIVRRRRQGVRDMRNEEQRFELYYAHDPIGAIPLGDMRRRDALEWLDRMHARGLSASTIRNAITIGRLMCAEATDRELMPSNPFERLKLRRQADARSHEGWTILDPDEQLALLNAVSDDEYHMVAFALHTGLRTSELWRLRTADIDLDARELVVRYSKGDKPPKGGKPRRVPLFGLGLVAAQHAVERGHKYAWPSPRTGTRRYDSSHPTRWHKWVKAAGITRRVRFYDLRHTCATSLLAGWWGTKWTLDEVRQMLGHSSQKVTERYAHLVDDTVRRRARETTGAERPTAWDESGASCRIWTDDLRFTKPLELQGFQLLALRRHHERFEATHDRLGGVVLQAWAEAVRVAEGDRLAKTRLDDLLREGARLVGGER